MSTDFLRSRPRTRRIIERGAQRLLDTVAAPRERIAPAPDAAARPPAARPHPAARAPAAQPPEPAGASAPDPPRFAREFDRGWLAAEGSPATTCLYERLEA